MHRHTRLLTASLVSLSCSFALAAQVETSPPADAQAETSKHEANTPSRRATEGWLHERCESMNDRVAKGNVDLIFIGDSITQSWEGGGKQVWAEYYGDRNAVNLGISGDRTQHVLWRLENGNIDGISPKVAVIMIGTNNSRANTAIEIADGIKAIVGLLREDLPDTKILLLDVFPRGKEVNDQRGKILQANQIARKLDDGEHVHYLAIGHHFIEDDGSITPEMMPDALHLTPAGYKIWAESIEEKLSELMGEEGDEHADA